MKPKLVVAAALLLALPGAAMPAQEMPPAIESADEALLCDLDEVIECWPGGECSTGNPEDVDLPRFVRFDLAAEAFSSPSPGFEGQAAAFTSFQRDEGRIAAGGHGRYGRTFSFIVNEATGELNGAVLQGGYSFVIFGVCIADD